MTEAELMARLLRDLGPLAVDANWSTTATAEQPYGSYSDAISDAKADAGVSGNLADVSSAATLIYVRRMALLACLERLELHYATLVDESSGGESGAAVTQKLSQMRAAIGAVRATLAAQVAEIAASAATATAASPTKASGFNLRGRRRPDYDVGAGNSTEA